LCLAKLQKTPAILSDPEHQIMFGAATIDLDNLADR